MALEHNLRVSLEDDQRSLAACRRENPEHAELSEGLNRWTLRRLDAAMKGYDQREARGEDPSLPRFRFEERWRSFGVYGLLGRSLNKDRIQLDGIFGNLRVHMHRPLLAGSKPIGLTFTRTARRWHVVILLAVEDTR